jgi:hypothetical protein
MAPGLASTVPSIAACTEALHAVLKMVKDPKPIGL